MKAYKLTKVGDFNDLVIKNDVQIPSINDDEVLVKINYIGINPIDWKIVLGIRPANSSIFPLAIGSEVSGVIEKVGKKVDHLKIGDRVTGLVNSGSQAEYAKAKGEKMVKLPDNISLKDAASLPMAAITARTLINKADPLMDDVVIVNGASGTVGATVVQILVDRGIKVFGTGSKENSKFIESIGATPLSYGSNLVKELAEFDINLDIALDAAGHGFVKQMLDIIPKNAIYTIADHEAVEKYGVQFVEMDSSGNLNRFINPLYALIENQEYKIEIAEVFPFDKITQALEASQKGVKLGKIIVEV